MRSQKVTNQTVRRLTIYFYYEYLVSNPIELVNRNDHMNKLDGKASAKMEDISFLIADFLSRVHWEKLAGIARIDLLTLLVQTLKSNIKSLVSEHEDNMNTDHVLAFTVDFINFVGVKMGVDYALYTRDIQL